MPQSAEAIVVLIGALVGGVIGVIVALVADRITTARRNRRPFPKRAKTERRRVSMGDGRRPADVS